MGQHDAILAEAYERLAAGDIHRRDPSEYTHAEVLDAVLLIAAEAQEQVAFEQSVLRAVMDEHRPARHLKVAA